MTEEILNHMETLKRGISDLLSCSISSQRRQWHPIPELLQGKSHGRRSLEGCGPWGCWGSDTTERLHFHFSLSCIEEGNGNPLQCSCLENPRDGGAWWAAIYGVTQSRTRLKWLSSRSSSFERLPKEFLVIWALKIFQIFCKSQYQISIISLYYPQAHLLKLIVVPLNLYWGARDKGQGASHLDKTSQAHCFSKVFGATCQMWGSNTASLKANEYSHYLHQANTSSYCKQ